MSASALRDWNVFLMKGSKSLVSYAITGSMRVQWWNWPQHV